LGTAADLIISNFLSKRKIASVIGQMGGFSSIWKFKYQKNLPIKAVLNIIAKNRNIQIFGHRS
jgi:hypothetical protein